MGILVACALFHTKTVESEGPGHGVWACLASAWQRTFQQFPS